VGGLLVGDVPEYRRKKNGVLLWMHVFTCFNRFIGGKAMGLIDDLFGKSPFGTLVEHPKKFHECIEMIMPLMETLAQENFEEIRCLHDTVSELE